MITEGDVRTEGSGGSDVTDDAMVTTILEAITEANRRYEYWSGGDWLIDAVTEGIMQAVVAEAVIDHQDDHTVVVEGSPFDLHRESNMTTSYQKWDDFSRFDIVVRDPCKNPTYIIELKRKWTTKEATKDLYRIATYHKEWGEIAGEHLRGGFLGFTVGTERSKQPKFLDTRKRRISNAARKVISDLGYESQVEFGEIWSTPYKGYVTKARQREGCAACIRLTTSQVRT